VFENLLAKVFSVCKYVYVLLNIFMKVKSPFEDGNLSKKLKLSKSSEETTRVVYEAANIDQEFLDEDVEALLKDLPNLVEAEKRLSLD